jgi:hypothetical protein
MLSKIETIAPYYNAAIKELFWEKKRNAAIGSVEQYVNSAKTAEEAKLRVDCIILGLFLYSLRYDNRSFCRINE